MNTYTIITKRIRNITLQEEMLSEVTGTLEELVESFQYMLALGNSRNEKVELRPQTIKKLVSNVQRAYSSIKEPVVGTKTKVSLQ